MPITNLQYDTEYTYDAAVRYDGEIRIYGRTKILEQDIVQNAILDKDLLIPSALVDAKMKDSEVDTTVSNLEEDINGSNINVEDVN